MASTTSESSWGTKSTYRWFTTALYVDWTLKLYTLVSLCRITHSQRLVEIRNAYGFIDRLDGTPLLPSHPDLHSSPRTLGLKGLCWPTSKLYGIRVTRKNDSLVCMLNLTTHRYCVPLNTKYRDLQKSTVSYLMILNNVISLIHPFIIRALFKEPHKFFPQPVIQYNLLKSSTIEMLN